MNAEQRAIDDLVATDEYKLRSDPTSLGAPESARQYLQNRLWKTFTDGMAAGRRIEREAMMQKLQKFVDLE